MYMPATKDVVLRKYIQEKDVGKYCMLEVKRSWKTRVRKTENEIAKVMYIVHL